MLHLRRRFLAVPESATKARSAVTVYATSQGFSGDALGDIQTAVGEAIANAIEHGNRHHGFFSLTCRFDDHTLIVEISDGGAGFDDANRPVENIKQRRTPSLRGYGLYIMRTLMNRVTFRDGGTTVVLEKRLGIAQESREYGP